MTSQQPQPQPPTSSSSSSLLHSSTMLTNTLPTPPTLPPPSQQQKPSQGNTFVHKLYNMVVDNQYQHLIAWAYTGSSFIVCNIMEFSRDVLPKHFKHNNFSSFVRQLNMYGFHKVNKSPRGHRTMAENQIWEFSHPKFLRDRPDLLDDIKRKTMETDTSRRDTRDLHGQMAMMQVTHSDMMQRINHLCENFNELVKELAETKQRQESQEQMMKQMMQIIAQQNGGHLPSEINCQQFQDPSTPSIFITTPDQQQAPPQPPTSMMQQMHSRAPGLTVQTQNLSPHYGATATSPLSPLSLSPYGTSPSPMFSDDESSLYSPHTPHTPRSSISQSSPSHFVMDPPTPQPTGTTTSESDSSAPAAFVVNSSSYDALSHG